MSGVDPDIAAFIRGIPKAELHVHIEGTLEAQMALDMAREKNIKLPFSNEEEIRRVYNFRKGLDDFLPVYYANMQVLGTEGAFRALGGAYFEKAAADNIRHVEFFFDPQAHIQRVIGPSIPFEVPFYGLMQAQGDAKEKFGITSGMIPNFLRHLKESDAKETLTQILAHREHVLGVGLDSAERGNPPSKFARVFKRAKDDGLRVTNHAAEEGPADYAWQSVYKAGAERIDHGNHIIIPERDSKKEKRRLELIAYMHDQGMGLTMCPFSALKLRGIKHIKDHPVRDMMDLGLKASIHSDDPAYFGGYINDNFVAVAEALKLTKREITILARNSFEISFLDDERKKTHLAEIDAYVIADAKLSGGSYTRTPAGAILPA